MATGTDVHRLQSHSPSPNLKHEPDCYIPWSSSDWHSNRSPIPTTKDEDLEGSDYNSSHSWYTINHNSYSDMVSYIVYYTTNFLNLFNIYQLSPNFSLSITSSQNVCQLLYYVARCSMKNHIPSCQCYRIIKVLRYDSHFIIILHI